MQEFLLRAFSWLIPPHDADMKRVYRWRVSMALCTMANSIGLAALTVLSFGIFPVVFQGFAHTRDVSDMGGQITEVRRYQIDGKIMDARSKQCALMNGPLPRNPLDESLNRDALLFAAGRLQGELEAFTRLVGHPYRLPGCAELLGANSRG